jgi:hypothetical protein
MRRCGRRGGRGTRARRRGAKSKGTAVRDDRLWRYPLISVAVLSGHRARPARGEQHSRSRVLSRRAEFGRPSASEVAEANFRVGRQPPRVSQ